MRTPFSPSYSHKEFNQIRIHPPLNKILTLEHPVLWLPGKDGVHVSAPSSQPSLSLHTGWKTHAICLSGFQSMMLGNELKNPCSQKCVQFSVYLTFMDVEPARGGKEQSTSRAAGEKGLGVAGRTVKSFATAHIKKHKILFVLKYRKKHSASSTPLLPHSPSASVWLSKFTLHFEYDGVLFYLQVLQDLCVCVAKGKGIGREEYVGCGWGAACLGLLCPTEQPFDAKNTPEQQNYCVGDGNSASVTGFTPAGDGLRRNHSYGNTKIRYYVSICRVHDCMCVCMHVDMYVCMCLLVRQELRFGTALKVRKP